MRILYLGFDIDGVGGIATYSRYQIRALRELGHQVTILSVDKSTTRIAEIGVAHRLPFADKLTAVRAILGWVVPRRRDFDLVMVNHVFLAGFGWALKRLAGVPYVINTYNIDILAKLPFMRERAFRGAGLVIADCQYTIDMMPSYHRRIPPTGLLYDPVDTSFFKPMEMAAARASLAARYPLDFTGKFVAVTVASMLLPPNKGHRQTIEAFAKLKDPRLLYLVVGGGPDRAAIEAHAQAQGVSEQVKFLGLVPQEVLPLAYAAADIAILVARGGPGWGEAVPLGLIEAAACARPFICGNEDGSVEAIDRSDANGVAIAPLDVDELAQWLKAMADDPARCRMMGAAGKRMVDRVFAFPVFVLQQQALLARLKIGAG